MYTPQKDDFEFISGRDLEIDENFSSQGYWTGVAVHFFRNKFAVTGLILVVSRRLQVPTNMTKLFQ